MNKPRIFLGSSGKQAKLLKAITRGLEDVADVEPWTTSFNPGRSTLDRLVELSQEVDFAAFVFAQDDWTTTDASESGEASPRDNVVFEAGLFGGALGIRRTFILHANGSKLPSDLLGLTSVRYDPATSPAEIRAINQKLRKAIETEGRRGSSRGAVVAALAHRAERERALGGEPPAHLARPRRWPGRERPGLAGRRHPRPATGARPPRSAGIRPASSTSGRASALVTRTHPQLEGTGEIRVESADRATGYWTTRSDRDPGLNARTAGVYLRAEPSTSRCWTAGAREERAQLIARRLQEWRSAANAP